MLVYFIFFWPYFQEIKTQLEGAIGEETFREIQRQRSETKSDSGSVGRRTSESSVGQGDGFDKDGGRKLSSSVIADKDGDRKHSGSVGANGVLKPKDKLIEIEKAETGSVRVHLLRKLVIIIIMVFMVA